MNKMSYRTPRDAELVARAWGKSLEKNEWFKVSSETDGVAEIRIFDVIGWPFIDAGSFLEELDGITAKEIRLRINSPGGDVFDGTAIYNAIKAHPAKFNVEIEGIAASMGSVIALAGDTVAIAENAWFMIHNPWTFMMGDYNDLRKEADLLERMSGVMSQTYQDKSGKDAKTVKSLMDEETWFSGSEAVENGFADTTIESADVSAKFNTSLFGKTPDDIQRAAHNLKPSKRDAERSLRDVGFSHSEAKAIVSGIKSQRDVDEDECMAILRKSIQTLKGVK